jgi:hypothetical protein
MLAQVSLDILRYAVRILGVDSAYEPAVPGDHRIFIIRRQGRCDHFGEVTGRGLKSHQVRLSPDRQLCSGVGRLCELNVDLFFADRIRHRSPVDIFRSWRNACVFHYGSQIVRNFKDPIHTMPTLN